ncbi:MAG: ribosomal L7Ae/L30e/S12e/Gadd45 family protein [Gemmatimonadetes bacterium]|nr:ribosomal L7Ae/L30e/S12e/Gadd45 family protein [Gemmatimonadota bacterium]
MIRTRWSGLLGLARRAGALAVGTAATREALRLGRARFVLLASDAAGPQRRKLEGLLAASGIPARVCADRAELGAAIGARQASALAVTDPRFAAQLMTLLAKTEENGLVVQGGR